MDAKGKWYKYPFEIEGRPKFPDEEEGEQDDSAPMLLTPQQPIVASQPSGPSFLEIIALMNEARKEARDENMIMMKMMFEQSRPAPPQADGIERTLSFVKDLLPILGQGGGGGGEPMPWYATVLMQMKDPLIKLVDTATNIAAQHGRQAPVPQPQPLVNRPVIQPAEPKEEPDMIASQFKTYLPVLLRGATKNTDPSVYVDMILDQVPQIAYDPLRKWLIEPGCLDKLVAIEPAIQYQQDWWEGLRGGLIEALNEELGHGVRSIQPESDSIAPTDHTTASSSPDTEGG